MRGATIRVILPSFLLPLLCLHGGLLFRLTINNDNVFDGGDAPTTFYRGVADKPTLHTHHVKILEETVNLLFMDNEDDARQYLEDNPVHSFKFYTYELPMQVPTFDYVSNCHEMMGAKAANLSRDEFIKQYCDWSESICTPVGNTPHSPYSKKRTNYNVDSAMARLFIDYIGPLRTNNISEATLKIVPYPGSWWNGQCSSWYGMPTDQNILAIQNSGTISLTDPSTLFLSMNNHAKLSVDFTVTKRPGQLVIPYLNTGLEYQPDHLISSMNPLELDGFYNNKIYALAAVYSPKISGNGYARRDFTAKIDDFFGNGTMKYNNGTLGDMKVYIRVIDGFSRTMPDEATTMQRYRESIFCPCFRGDRPDVKRFFDVLLSGCIPVLMTHYTDGIPSYFAGVASNAVIYPWAARSFGKSYPNMGIDYSKLVIEIEESVCYVDCMVATLEKLLQDPVALREKQVNVAKYARLFSYGLQHNAFQHVDAMSALLIRARHFAVHEDSTE